MAETVRVMGFLRVIASCGLLLFALVVVAVVAHVLGVVLLGGVLAKEEATELLLVESHWINAFEQLILLAEGLPLEETNRVFRIIFLVLGCEHNWYGHVRLETYSIIVFLISSRYQASVLLLRVWKLVL